MAQKLQQPVAEQIGGGQIPGDEEHGAGRDDFALVKTLALLLDLQQARDQVVARFAAASLDLREELVAQRLDSEARLLGEAHQLLLIHAFDLGRVDRDECVEPLL